MVTIMEEDGGNSFGDQGDWIAVIILGECNAEIVADLFRRDGADF